MTDATGARSDPGDSGRFRAALRHAGGHLRRALSSVAHRAGLYVGSRRRNHLVPRHYYSPIPDVQEIPDDTWNRRSPLSGIAFDTAEQMAFAEARLAPYTREFSPAIEPTDNPGEFFLQNGSYQGYDAEILYGMVRYLKPRRVIEIGSGFSSLVIAEACEANRRDGATAAHTAIDPYPRCRLPERIEVAPRKVEELPLAFFDSLGAGDILFVDSSHTVRLGGDVNYLVLDVLPNLTSGVVVHFHDVFLPWHYPRWWVEEAGLYWNEQYLLQAFLSQNRDYKVLFAAHAVSRDLPERLVNLVSGRRDANPSAFWITRV